MLLCTAKMAQDQVKRVIEFYEPTSSNPCSPVKRETIVMRPGRSS